MMARRSAGFTIVELLIVIVVIGILAAISIVAYSGIQKRAIAASLVADLVGASKQLRMEYIDRNAYPATLADARDGLGLQSSGTTTFQYSVNNTATPQTFCLTATRGTLSYTTTQGSTPIEGSCAGHDRAGVAAITNLILNPSFEASTASNGANISASGGSRTFIPDATAPAGNTVMRATFTSTTSLGWGQYSGTVQPGIYTGSLFVRSNKPISLNTYFEGTAGRSTITGTGTQTLTPNTWKRLWMTVTVTTSGTLKVGSYYSGGGAAVVVGDYVDFDAVMLSQGSTIPPFGDGSFANWLWNGDPNVSSSTGPPLQ